MADGDGGGGEGSCGSAEWQPIYDRVQAQAEALSADRARLEAASKVQRESWEAARRLQRSVEELQAAAREKDAENGRLRAEAADARKKLQEVRQADAGRRVRWEAAYAELLLGANQKLAELRDDDMEDFRTCAEDPNSMGVQGCARLSQNTADQACVASDLSTELKKLKQAYEALSSKKDKEVSALLSEKELVCNQLGIMEQDYSALLMNKKGEAAQAIEAAQKLQQSVDSLKVLAKKKDDEIGRLRAKAVAAEKKLQTAQKLQQSLDGLKVLAQKNDDEIGRLRVEAVEAEKKLQKMHSLVKEKDDETQRLKGRHPESIKKRNKDICETHKNSRSDDPAVTVRVRGNLKYDGLREMVEEDYISEKEMVEKDEQDETSQKRISNDDDEQNGSDEDGDEQSGSDEDGDKQSGSDDNGNQQSRSDDDDGQNKSGEHDEDEDEDEQSGHDVETTNNAVQKPVGNLKRKRDVRNAQVANSKSHMESNGVTERSWSSEPPEPLHCQKLVTTQGRHSVMCSDNWTQYVSDVKDSLADQPVKLKLFLWFLCNFKNWTIDFAASSIKAVLDGHPKLIHRFNEFFPNNHQTEEKDSIPMKSRVAKRRRSYERPPHPLRLRKLVVPHAGSSDGRVFMSSGNWAQFASDVKDSFADEPERHEYFVRCLPKHKEWSCNIRDAASSMRVVLRGHPELVRGFNLFLPLNCEIEVEEEEEGKQHPSQQPV